MDIRTHTVRLFALLSVLLIGCSGSGTKTVQGVVNLEGVPVAGATVLFMPDALDGSRPASGITSSDGMFRLTTYKSDDGVKPGNYRVLIQKTEAAKDLGAAQRSALERAKSKIDEKSLQQHRKTSLPAVYAKFDTTPLRCSVPVKGKITFNLNKDGQP